MAWVTVRGAEGIHLRHGDHEEFKGVAGLTLLSVQARVLGPVNLPSLFR